MASAAFDLTSAYLGSPQTLAYGWVRGAGNRVLLQEIAEKYRVGFHILGRGPWESSERIWLNRALNGISGSTVHFHSGEEGEIGYGMAADSNGPNQHVESLWANTIGSLDYVTFSGLSYIAVQVPPDPSAPGPDLEILGDYKALKCRAYDNTGVQTAFAWTMNPAWWVLDYHIRTFILREGKFNQPLVAAERARIDFASFYDAAVYFDETLSNGKKRFGEEHGVVFFEQGLTADRVFDKLLLMCRSYTLERAGKIYLYADKARSSVFTFGSDQVIPGSLRILGRSTSRTARNRIQASWREYDLASGSSDNATRFAAGAKNFDNEAHQRAIGSVGPGLSPIPKVLPMALDYGVNTSERVGRLGNFQRLRALGDDVDENSTYLAPSDIQLAAFDPSAAFRAIKPGDRVTLHSSLGEEAGGMSFEVLRMKVRANGAREFSGIEYQANAFPDTVVAGQTTSAPVPGTGLVLPFVLSGAGNDVLVPLDETLDQGGRYATGPASINNRPLTNPLTASDAGATATISIAAFTLRLARPTGSIDISINSGSVTALSFNTLYHIYYDDPNLAGGAVTYAATTTRETALNGAGRVYVGSISTPLDGGSDTMGNNDGGVGGQYGAVELYWPTTDGGIFTNPERAYDIDSTTFSAKTQAVGSSEFVLQDWGRPVRPGAARTIKIIVDAEAVYTLNGGAGGLTATLRYSINNGSSWTNFWTVTDVSKARLLASATIAVQDIPRLRVSFLLTGPGAADDTMQGKLFEAYVEVTT